MWLLLTARHLPKPYKIFITPEAVLDTETRRECPEIGCEASSNFMEPLQHVLGAGLKVQGFVFEF